MHHKRKRAKQQRAGCLLCHPSKLTANAKADRAAGHRQALELERVGADGGVVRDHRTASARA